MYLRSPFLRLFAHDLEHMMNRSLIRHEMMMRQELERAMNTFAALEQQTIEPARPSRTLKSKGAEHKIEAPKEGENKVDSLKAKESEELSLQQPARRDVFSPWNSGFDDFFGDISPFGYGHRSIFDRFNAIERYADEMRAEMDRRFKMAEEKQEYPELKDPENTSYFMRLETNDNGNVKVNPLTDWCCVRSMLNSPDFFEKIGKKGASLKSTSASNGASCNMLCLEHHKTGERTKFFFKVLLMEEKNLFLLRGRLQ